MVTLLALALGFLSFGGETAPAAAELATAEFDIRGLREADVLMALRTIAEVRDLEAVDERTVRARGPAPMLAVAAAVVAELRRPADGESPGVVLGEDDVLGRVDLRGVTGPQAMAALRAGLAMRRIAIIAVPGEPLIVLLRDRRTQVEAGLAALRALQAGGGRDVGSAPAS